MNYVALLMRKADQEEIWAADRFKPFEALAMGRARSDLLWTVIIDDLPAAIGGVVPLGPKHGVCWMLGTDRIKLAPEWFLVESKRILGEMLVRYSHLTNFVDERNVVCLNWLRWLGFKVLPSVSYGVDKIPFCQVIREV